MKSKRDWWDFIFPTAGPLPDDENERIEQRLQAAVAALPAHSPSLAQCAEALDHLYDRENARRLGAEARLTSILGLSTIAGTIVFGFLFGLAGASHFQSRVPRWIIAGGAIYLVLQICSAMLAAVRGLSRQSYDSLTFSDVTPTQTESEQDYLLRRCTRDLQILSDNSFVNNSKVTQMAVAHCAMRNFLWGLLLLAVIGGYAATKAATTDDIIDSIKKNPELKEMLRGPRGEEGKTGPKGEPGIPCLNGASREHSGSYKK
jgi:hypothetical protein